MISLKQQEELSTVFDFHQQVIICSYVFTKNKALIIQSLMHVGQKLVMTQRKNQKLLNFITSQSLDLT